MKFSQNPAEGSDTNFLKIKPGEEVTGVFRGEPLEFYVKWQDKKALPAKAGDPGAKFRFKLNFVTKINNVYTPVVWEQGSLVYNQLKELNSEYQLDKTVVKIKRKGSELDTEYTILPVKGGEITPNLEETLSLLKLNDLNAKEEKLAPETNKDFNPSEELPF